jgi:hypothetical protein
MSNQLKALEILKDSRNNINYSLEHTRVNKDELGKYKDRLKYLNEAIEELEALEYKDKLAELEKVILDYYLAKGYEVGIGGWAFNVEIESNYKSKQLLIYFRESMYEHYSQVFIEEVETTKEMFDKAIKHFKIVDKEDL